MPVVTSDLLAGIFTNFRALWEEQFLAATNKDTVRNILSMEVPSNTFQETYNWFGTVPAMREWVGERQLSSLSKSNYTIINKDWESTLEVERNAIEDDRLGIIRPRINQLALEAVRSQEQLVVDTLRLGISELAYDGQFFFDTDHVTPGATFQTSQSNKLTGTGVTLAALQTDYPVAVAAMRNFKDDQGRPMNISPTHVMVPPALEGVFRTFLNSEFVPGGTNVAGVSNVWRNSATLLVNSYLTDATDWYLLSLDQPVKPIIFQMRRAVQFNALDNPNNNEAAFMRKLYLYGVDGRWNAGYGFWQLAVLTTNT
jgi:phage major head subunit gpT-like protein